MWLPIKHSEDWYVYLDIDVTFQFSSRVLFPATVVVVEISWIHLCRVTHHRVSWNLRRGYRYPRVITCSGAWAKSCHCTGKISAGRWNGRLIRREKKMNRHWCICRASVCLKDFRFGEAIYKAFTMKSIFAVNRIVGKWGHRFQYQRWCVHPFCLFLCVIYFYVYVYFILYVCKLLSLSFSQVGVCSHLSLLWKWLDL